MLQNAASGCEGMNLKSLGGNSVPVRFRLRAPTTMRVREFRALKNRSAKSEAGPQLSGRSDFLTLSLSDVGLGHDDRGVSQLVTVLKDITTQFSFVSTCFSA
ncbi:hypothetical protein IQ22_03826 [Pseudomonas duriflava]|uniref:Uncharacterized protein n=1 Tax=Pseudomonas duriflava TaxID=459528 RepID=A0A562Q276_9PSED|nr:hypothetical protein IQ22_03826 [Pseudomonas duriflava]